MLGFGVSDGLGFRVLLSGILLKAANATPAKALRMYSLDVSKKCTMQGMVMLISCCSSRSVAAKDLNRDVAASTGLFTSGTPSAKEITNPHERLGKTDSCVQYD